MNTNTGFWGYLTSILKQYFPQIITLIGTLLGTILGWFLKYLQDNIGKTEVKIEEFEIYKDKNNRVGYNVKMFVCNHSLKPKYIKEIYLILNSKNIENRKLFPKYDIKKDYYISSKSDFNIMNLRYNEPMIFYLCDIIENIDFHDYHRVEIVYKNEKGKLKKLKANLSIEQIQEYPDGALFPC